MSKRHIAAGLLLLLGGAKLYVLNQRQITVEITPRPLLYLVADTQRELERIPLELTRVSDAQENQIGEELAHNFGLTPARSSDAEAQRIRGYLNEVGARVAAHASRKAIRYRFHYEASNSFVNAAALPGGQIVVGRGLLRLLESEDELAAILGHEIAHVDRRHAIERLQYELKSRQLGLGGLYQLGAPGVALFQAGYTKEKELEADRVGLEFAVAAHYSPGGAIDVMRRFAKLNPASGTQPSSPVEEMAGVPLQALREYFRSHPPEGERIAAFESETAAHRWNVKRDRQPLAIRAIFLAESARELDRRGDFKGSIARYQEALKLDPDYVAAWEGLARANWRSGDAEATVKAVTEALRRNPERPDWRLLARALAVSDRRNAPARFQKLYQTLYLNSGSKRSVWVELQLAGLEFLNGRRGALDAYHKLLESGLQANMDAEVRRRMAWWMYRAGKPRDAEKELNAARQRFPQQMQIYFDLAWVLSDLGRQADAQESLEHFRANSERTTPEQLRVDSEGIERTALAALLSWRTDQHDAAKSAFQKLAEKDPAWMEPGWAANNYSPAAAATFSELRLAEIARRKQAETLARRTQPSPGPSRDSR